VSAVTGVGLVLALASAMLTNLAYLGEHDAAAELPVLCMRRPLQSARLLLGDRSWLLGFAMESGGFLLYAAALALASLALVQNIAAGGIGLLAFAGPCGEAAARAARAGWCAAVGARLLRQGVKEPMLARRSAGALIGTRSHRLRLVH
jgi:hypothetical protein